MRINDLIFASETAMVNDYLEEVMGLQAQGPIQVVPDYPLGWHAFVPADDKAMMIGCTRDGYMSLVDIMLCRGFYPNGNMRLVGFDESENFDRLMEFYEREFAENYYRSPLNCAGSACNSSSANCVMCNNARREI
jgi:hypothetical protein